MRRLLDRHGPLAILASVRPSPRRGRPKRRMPFPRRSPRLPPSARLLAAACSEEHPAPAPAPNGPKRVATRAADASAAPAASNDKPAEPPPTVRMGALFMETPI